jgi:glycosyltransferase involved in cell wall biosynthesis
MSASVSLTNSTELPLSTREANGKVQALFVLNSLAVGGSETKIVRVANGLLARGITAGIAYLKAPHDLRDSVEPRVPVAHLERRGKFSFGAARRLRGLLRSYQPDVVLAVNLYPTLYLSLAALGLSVMPRRVALLNTTTFDDSRRWRQSFYNPVLRRLDSIVYGCELQRTLWRETISGTDISSSVIYNGVDVDWFDAKTFENEARTLKQQLAIPQNAFVVGCVGRFAAAKNQKILIQAIADLRQRSVPAHLMLVGDGPLRRALEDQAAQLGVSKNITFLGQMRDVRPALACMDVFVLPSTHVETFSNAALEAMSMARPVVLSRIGGAAEMITDGVQGYTLDIATLSADLPRVLMHLHDDLAFRTRLGEAARERVVGQFSVHTMVASYASLIEANSLSAIHR